MVILQKYFFIQKTIISVELNKDRKIVIGVVHLLPLPGAPLHESFEEVIKKALKDAKAIEEGGADALIIENYGDMPFLTEVGKETIACMTSVAKEIKNAVSIPLGVNVLRNDGFGALAIAKAVKAEFVRINQLYFTSITPEGVLTGNAGKLLRYRKIIGCKARIFADIHVKHAIHFARIEDYASEFNRSMADAAIITGTRTGIPPDIAHLKLLRDIVELPVLAGSGVNHRNILDILKYADGVIVGTYFKKEPKFDSEIDVKRVKKIVSVAKL
jgi:hypothetical protein